MVNNTPQNVALCTATYRAEHVSGAVIIYATGVHPTTGYQVFFEQALIDIFPPQFSLWHVNPTDILTDVLTPFFAHISFKAAETVERMTVHDANGAHEVAVEQAPEHGMPSQRTQEVAEAILEDVRRAGYYRDPSILADFLQGQFGLQVPPGAATKAAETILDDLQGAGFYNDPVILARYLDGQFGQAAAGTPTSDDRPG